MSGNLLGLPLCTKILENESKRPHKLSTNIVIPVVAKVFERIVYDQL